MFLRGKKTRKSKEKKKKRPSSVLCLEFFRESVAAAEVSLLNGPSVLICLEVRV